MALKIGIVGLPNVGKSTLFNALTKSKQADAQNYPFCTIDPNIGVVEVPDHRLQQLASTSNSKNSIPTTIEFVDIAGLVQGAAKGEGLGNKFLSHIREVDAIAQVVRVFTDGNITHVHENVDPQRDLEVINLELSLADLETIQKQQQKVASESKSGKTGELEKKANVLERLSAALTAGGAARDIEITDEDELAYVKSLHLLTRKPMMIIENSDEQIPDEKHVRQSNTVVVQVCARLEAELAEMSDEDAAEFLQELGIAQTGLDKVIQAGYELLKLVTYFTSGEQETRAWTVAKDTVAPKAAAVIHTDFEKGFIKADVAQWEDFVNVGGWAGVKETGKLRLEGKAYEIKDGDVCYFHVA